MKDTIDCLFIGHNQVNFSEYEKRVRGRGSCAYRDLNLNFIYHRDRPYTASGVFNEMAGQDVALGSMFSAAIAYLGTYLYRRGFSFDYVNDFRHEREYLARLLREREILAIAITTTLYVDMVPILEIIQFVRQFHNKAKIIVGGPFIYSQFLSLQPQQLDCLFRSIGADYYVVSSQGEAALVKLLEGLKQKRPAISQIHNIYYMADGDKSLYHAGPVSVENNNLSGNMVDWSLFAHRVGEQATVRTSISCPFSCSFCRYPLYAGVYRTATVEEIQGELDQLNNITSLKIINFIDDTFNVPMERFKEILRMMINRRYRFKWHSYFRCQFADEEAVALMKESGCKGVFLGLESGSNTILKNMNKKATREKYTNGIRLLKQYGIPTFGSFIVGFPGETQETVLETLQLIEESGIDFYRAQLWYYDPTTPIMKQKEMFRLQGFHLNWSHYTMDSRTAADWVDRLFVSVKNAVWVPQYHFNIQKIFGLMNRGMTLEQVKQFLSLFNQAIGQRMDNPVHKNISPRLWAQLTQLVRTSIRSPNLSTMSASRPANYIQANMNSNLV